ncbi:MAG: S8 family serine peptidase [Candidatus Zixiibacteriota bacterium]
MTIATTQKLIALTLLLAASTVCAQVMVPQSVQSAVETLDASSYIEVLLSFENDLDISAVKMSQMRDKLSRDDNYRNVMNRLESNRAALENEITPTLESMKADGRVESFRFFTVSKTVLVRTRVDNVDNLLNLPGVDLINMNTEVSLIEPVENDAPSLSPSLVSSNPALQTINVPTLWAQGYTGKGSVVCSFDTGVDGDHEMLNGKWRGTNKPDASSYWFAPRGDSLPYDNIGHGTHTMGVMIGSTASDTIGVAPAATFICAAVIDQGANFSTTIADILDAFDWALNPDGDINTTDDIPDVINNSWGVPNSIYGDCENTFWSAIDNVEAAGVVCIFAAGNEGPEPSTIRNPADRASSPLNAMSIGAVDPSTLIVADFSSRGPSICNGAIKPEVVAPGVQIFSSYKDGGYKLMSGTSMAAPFISGLVALMRQYNPDATVEQIKNALISAAADLGPTGEDNAYGHGIVDASRVLEFLPAPTTPQAYVSSFQVSGGDDTFADPGEQAAMTMILHEPTGELTAVDAWLTCTDDDIMILGGTQRFTFSEKYAVSPAPFTLSIASEAISGKVVEMTVNIQVPGSSDTDTRTIEMTIGHTAPGRIFTSASNSISFSASEFGQYGLGDGSIYQAGGEGFRFNGSDNLLYEAGLIIGRNPSMVSDGIRDENGRFKESNFIPDTDYSVQSFAAGDETVTTGFSDGDAQLPIPVTIEQKVWTSDGNYTVIECEFTNPTAERLDWLATGFFFDFDLGANDEIGFDSLMGIYYQYNQTTGQYIGLVGLSVGEFNFTANVNGDEKTGFTTSEKFGMVNSSGISLATTGSDDWYVVISQRQGLLDAFESTSIAVAIIAGYNTEDLRQAAEAALGAYGAYLDVDDIVNSLPTEIELSQNYPNPFNPTTTIEFAMKSTQHVTLTVYNITGQRVKTLYDEVAMAGMNSVVWDGDDEYGQATASGIYFYRLTAEDGSTETKKMILLK